MARATHAAPLLALAIATAAALAPSRAAAGPFTDDLSKCLVNKSSAEDKTLLVQWIFTTIATHPSVQSLAVVPAGKREDVTRRAAKLFEDLLAIRCNEEARKAVQYEGPSVFSASFEVLGKIAAGGLLTDPTVGAETAKLAEYMDQKRLQAAFPPVGAAPAAAPAAASAPGPADAPAPAPAPAK